MKKHVFAVYADAMQSGKSTVAQLLCEHNFRTVAVATPLKAMIRTLMEHAGYVDSFIFEALHGNQKNAPLALLSGRSARELMQTLGTEWGRNMVGTDLWLASVSKSIRAVHESGYNVVIEDVRYTNEMNFLVNQFDATAIKVVRPGVADTSGHSSEGGLKDFKPLAIIHNNQDAARYIDDLRAKVDALVRLSK